ncbi:MAG TPA: TorF family putative porin [Burkholderiales bacterium]|nr:TorF family putative porin [Burkholderiales bacterium]
MLKKTVVAGAVAAALGSGLAQAAEPAGPHTFTGNVGFYSQYIFRGLTQTDRDPAIQGGFDYSHSSGFYLGTWGSNISWLRDGVPPAYSNSGSLEWDFYGGWKWGFAPDWTLDLGGLYYWYPGDASPGLPKADTFEVYAGLSWKWLSAKFSYVASNKAFGVADADGTYYVDFGLNVPLGDFAKEATGWTIFAHYGIQKYRGGPASPNSNDDLYSYNDWKLGVSYALPKDFTVGAFYSDTSSLNNRGYGSVGEGGPFPRNLGKGTGTIYIQKTF